MKLIGKKWKVVVSILVIIIVGYFALDYFVSKSIRDYYFPKLQECPDAIVGNMMPGGGSDRGAYYLKNGEARKISDYDEEWASANCEIEDKRVW